MAKLIESLVSQILYEGRTQADVDKALYQEIQVAYGTVKTMTEKTMPFALTLTKIVLQTRNEFKLSAFFNQCIFFEVKNPHPSLGWMNTAGVIPWHNGTVPKTIFLYDRKFINSLVTYYQNGKEISQQKFKQLYAQNPRDPSLSYEMGEMLLLFAHEAMHIFRSHGERGQKQGKDGKQYNIAADMVINYTLTDKIKKIAGMDIKMPKGGWNLDKQKYTEWLRKKKKYQKDEDDDSAFNRNLNADITYEYYEDEFKKNQPPPPPPQKTEVKVGGLRKIRNGPHKGKYVKVTKINDDGSYEAEVVDILKEVEKERKKRGLQVKPKKKKRGRPKKSAAGSSK